MLEVYKSVLGPEPTAQLLARHYLTGVLDQNGYNLEGLFLKLNPEPLLAQFTTREVKFEDPEPHPSDALRRLLHRLAPRQLAA